MEEVAKDSEGGHSVMGTEATTADDPGRMQVCPRRTSNGDLCRVHETPCCSRYSTV